MNVFPSWFDKFLKSKAKVATDQQKSQMSRKYSGIQTFFNFLDFICKVSNLPQLFQQYGGL